jgi:NAD+ synthase (glutamine-hydrolysing)
MVSAALVARIPAGTGQTRNSLLQAKSNGCSYRLGPELEVPGYGCEDHFLETDTVSHSWEVLVDLINSGHTDGIVVDLGMPVLHNGVRYNCRVILLNRKVLHIRPKLHLADDGNYREGRYFTTWKRLGEVERYRYGPAAVYLCSAHREPLSRAHLWSTQNS